MINTVICFFDRNVQFCNLNLEIFSLHFSVHLLYTCMPNHSNNKVCTLFLLFLYQLQQF